MVQLCMKVKGVWRENTLQCESVVQHSTRDCCPIRALWGKDKLVVKATRGFRLRWERTHCALHASILHRLPTCAAMMTWHMLLLPWLRWQDVNTKRTQTQLPKMLPQAFSIESFQQWEEIEKMAQACASS